MRTIITRTNAYKFDELDEAAKQAALENMAYINVEGFDWWDTMYEDAENIGLKITSFDLDRNKHAEGEFLKSPLQVIESIMEEHGKDCETHKIAFMYLDNHKQELEEEIDQFEDDFRNELLEEYANMLERDYEYQTGEEAIIGTIEANEYEFTKEGELI